MQGGINWKAGKHFREIGKDLSGLGILFKRLGIFPDKFSLRNLSWKPS